MICYPTKENRQIPDTLRSEIQLFDLPRLMQNELKTRRLEGYRLSCMLATYDWPFDKAVSYSPSIYIQGET